MDPAGRAYGLAVQKLACTLGILVPVVELPPSQEQGHLGETRQI